MYQAHLRESSLLTWTGGMVWKPETQDVAAQPQPSSLHCILRVDEVCRMLNLPGSLRGILQTWENWIDVDKLASGNNGRKPLVILATVTSEVLPHGGTWTNEVIDKSSGSRQSLNRISDTVANLPWYRKSLKFWRFKRKDGPVCAPDVCLPIGVISELRFPTANLDVTTRHTHPANHTPTAPRIHARGTQNCAGLSLLPASLPVSSPYARFAQAARGKPSVRDTSPAQYEAPLRMIRQPHKR
ncbi:hypothetical protein LA080_004967 [Diaporthe eres]|nr:hypothetical protein LA080_004967 [Diaporthe eres]